MFQSQAMKAVCLHIFFLIFQENCWNFIFGAGEKNSPTISLFRKLTAKIPSNYYAKRYKDSISPRYIVKLQCWLGQSLPDFGFTYLHFNIPPRIANVAGDVSDEKTNGLRKCRLFIQ